MRPTLPIEGVSMLLGNDLSGDKVVVNPIVSDNPVLKMTVTFPLPLL